MRCNFNEITAMNRNIKKILSRIFIQRENSVRRNNCKVWSFIFTICELCYTTVITHTERLMKEKIFQRHIQKLLIHLRWKDLFAKIIDGFQLLIVFEKSFILDFKCVHVIYKFWQMLANTFNLDIALKSQTSFHLKLLSLNIRH